MHMDWSRKDQADYREAEQYLFARLLKVPEIQLLDFLGQFSFKDGLWFKDGVVLHHSDFKWDPQEPFAPTECYYIQSKFHNPSWELFTEGESTDLKERVKSGLAKVEFAREFVMERPSDEFTIPKPIEASNSFPVIVQEEEQEKEQIESVTALTRVELQQVPVGPPLEVDDEGIEHEDSEEEGHTFEREFEVEPIFAAAVDVEYSKLHPRLDDDKQVNEDDNSVVQRSIMNTEVEKNIKTETTNSQVATPEVEMETNESASYDGDSGGPQQSEDDQGHGQINKIENEDQIDGGKTKDHEQEQQHQQHKPLQQQETAELSPSHSSVSAKTNNDNEDNNKEPEPMGLSTPGLGRNRRVRQKNRYFEDFHCMNLKKGSGRSRDDYDAYEDSSAFAPSRSSNRRSTTDSSRPSDLTTTGTSNIGTNSQGNSDKSSVTTTEGDSQGFVAWRHCRKCASRTAHAEGKCQDCVYRKIQASNKRQKTQRSNAAQASSSRSSSVASTPSANAHALKQDSQEQSHQQPAPQQTRIQSSPDNNNEGEQQSVATSGSSSILETPTSPDGDQIGNESGGSNNDSTKNNNGTGNSQAPSVVEPVKHDKVKQESQKPVSPVVDESLPVASTKRSPSQNEAAPTVATKKSFGQNEVTLDASNKKSTGQNVAINGKTSDISKTDSMIINNNCSAHSDNSNRKCNGHGERGLGKGQDSTTKDELHGDHLIYWTPEQVAQFISSSGFTNESELFKLQAIDGMSLWLMKRADFTYGLNMKLGPALKLYDQVCKLKRKHECHMPTAS